MIRSEYLAIDVAARRVELDGRHIPLTRSEFALLHVLASRPGVAMSHREILRAMWGADWQTDTTPLQVHVSRLRRKMGESGSTPRRIVTVHGIGYRFEPCPDAAAMSSTTGARGPVQHVVLVFDRALVLRTVVPPVTFCGWHPDAIIGRRFIPSGLDPGTSMRLVEDLLARGAREVTGMFDLRTADGGRVRVRAHVTIEHGPANDLLGVRLQLEIPGGGCSTSRSGMQQARSMRTGPEEMCSAG